MPGDSLAEAPTKEYPYKNTFYSWFVVVLAGTGGMLLGYDNGAVLPMSRPHIVRAAQASA